MKKGHLKRKKMQKENSSFITIQRHEISHYHMVSNDVCFESKMSKAKEYLFLEPDCQGSNCDSPLLCVMVSASNYLCMPYLF